MFGPLSVTFDSNRAIAILDSVQGTATWDISTAVATCLALAPSDAHYQRTITIASPPAIQRVYFSASLAPLLPANDFTDEQGNTDKPGTFGMVLTPDSSDSSRYDSCSVQAGLQQV